MKILRVTTWTRRALATVLGFSLVWSASLSTQAAGLAVFKDHPFQSDAVASILVYSMIQETATTYELDLGSRQMVLDRSKIVAHMMVPDLLPTIDNESGMKWLRENLATLSAFAARYKNAASILAPHIDRLKTAIARCEAGDVRINSKWLSKAEYGALLQRMEESRVAYEQAAKEAQQMAQVAEAKKRASEAELQKRMQQAANEKKKWEETERARETAYIAEQKSKGLEKYYDKWLPKDEVAALLQRDEEVRKAGKMVRENSVRDMEYSVLAVRSEGMLVRPTGGAIPERLNLGVILLYQDNLGTVAEGDLGKADVYWCGTQVMDTSSGQVSVHSYCLDESEAIDRVRAVLFGTENTKDDSGGRRPDMVGAPAPADPANPLTGASGNGSGFFIGNEGYFVTNAHVVENASVVELYYDRKLLPARVMHISRASDLALLKVNAAVAGLPIAEEEMDLGVDVMAVGYPRASVQGIEPKVTKGIISSKRGLQDDDTRYQTDASIQPGNSGGPLADSTGRVVGVIVSTLLGSSKTDVAPQNVNYAVKSTELAAFLRSRKVNFKAQAPAGNVVKTVVAASALVVTKE